MIKLVQLNEDLEHLSDELKDKVEVALNDTEAQIALDADDLKKKIKDDNKVAVDSTNELAKKTNADGKASEIFESLNEDEKEVKDQSLSEDLDDVDSNSPEEFGISSAIAELIKRGWDNIDQINSYLATFESAPESLKTALNSMLDDNMIHIGILEDELKKISNIEIK